MRFALIGAGRIGRLHATVLASLPTVEDVLIVDVDAERATAVADAVGGRAIGSIEEAVGLADAVAIAASTESHAGIIRCALEQGRPTFCEKPLATDLAGSIALGSDIESAGVPFQLGFQRRFDPGYMAARQAIESGALGTVYLLRLAGHDAAPPHESYLPGSGGIFRDYSVHDFDVLRWLTGGEVAEVYADGGVRGFPVFAKYDDVDSAVATLRLADGVLAVLTTARHDPLGYDVRAEVFGSRDSIAVGLGPRTPLRSVEPGVEPSGEPGWPGFLARFEEAYRNELIHFAEVARGEAASPCSARDGVEALRIAEAATLSLAQHRVVPLAEIPGGARRSGE
jgi:myo-inositol 2-dehydrogenase / D-chiro-inositol 1-dehydrogenase